MGLLDRASVAVRRREAAPGAPRKGLLKRSLELLGPEDAGQPAAGPAVDYEQIASRLVAEVRSLPRTIDLPSRLLSLLSQHLGIAQGALLLHDPRRLVYAPWALAGFDQTTHRRLRIPPDACDAFTKAAAGTGVEISDPAGLGQFQPFFSTREFSLITRLLLAPLSARGILAGMLLVAETGEPVGEGLLDCLARFAAEAAPSLQQLRQRMMQPEAFGAAAGDAREQLARWLLSPSAAARSFTVVPFSLEGYERRVLAANPYLDPFRLEEDLRSIVAGFAADLGRAVHLGRCRFLAALQDLAPGDLDLFSHQLAGLLASLVAEPPATPSDVVLGTAGTFPEGTKPPAKLLAELAPS